MPTSLWPEQFDQDHAALSRHSSSRRFQNQVSPSSSRPDPTFKRQDVLNLRIDNPLSRKNTPGTHRTNKSNKNSNHRHPPRGLLKPLLHPGRFCRTYLPIVSNNFSDSSIALPASPHSRFKYTNKFPPDVADSILNLRVSNPSSPHRGRGHPAPKGQQEVFYLRTNNSIQRSNKKARGNFAAPLPQVAAIVHQRNQFWLYFGGHGVQ